MLCTHGDTHEPRQALACGGRKFLRPRITKEPVTRYSPVGAVLETWVMGWMGYRGAGWGVWWGGGVGCVGVGVCGGVGGGVGWRWGVGGGGGGGARARARRGRGGGGVNRCWRTAGARRRATGGWQPTEHGLRCTGVRAGRRLLAGTTLRAQHRHTHPCTSPPPPLACSGCTHQADVTTFASHAWLRHTHAWPACSVGAQFAAHA